MLTGAMTFPAVVVSPVGDFSCLGRPARDGTSRPAPRRASATQTGAWAAAAAVITGDNIGGEGYCSVMAGAAGTVAVVDTATLLTGVVGSLVVVTGGALTVEAVSSLPMEAWSADGAAMDAGAEATTSSRDTGGATSPADLGDEDNTPPVRPRHSSPLSMPGVPTASVMG